jgi:iron complex outermembrane recepter protein
VALRPYGSDAMSGVVNFISLDHFDVRSSMRSTTPCNLFDFYASYDVNDTWLLRLGVNNLTDEGPVTVSSSQTGTDASVFDVLGRSYYLGLRIRM